MADFYIDFENVHYRGLIGIDNLTKADKVFIYCRENEKFNILNYINRRKISIRSKLEFIFIAEYTKNALDFVLLSDLASGYRKGNVIFVVSDDKGYDAAINNLQKKLIFVSRCSSIADRSYQFIINIR